MTAAALHVTALKTVEHALPGTPESESQYLRAVASFENAYGTSGTWVGSHNWGCLTGKGDLGSLPHGDTTPNKDGTQRPVTALFRKYSSDEKGAIGLAGTLLKPATVAAIRRGDLAGAAACQYGHGYFAGHSVDGAVAVTEYANGLARHLRDIAAATGEHIVFDLSPVTPATVLASWRSYFPTTTLASGVLITRQAGAAVATQSPPAERHYALVEIATGNRIATTSLTPANQWTGWKKV